MDKEARIYVAGHRGLVGSAIVRAVEGKGFYNLILKSSKELELRIQQEVEEFYREYRPDYVFVAAAKVGGIWANNTYPAEFIYDNLMIESNLIHGAYKSGVKKLLFLGSTCIYPKLAPQPLKEEYLLTGPLEPTNEWYAVAKIAGIKLCQAYRRQYGCNFISAMPTNLYGPGDNFDLENSHVLPALIRKFHLAKLAASGNLDAIQQDEDRFGKIPNDILNNLGIHRNPSCQPRFSLQANVTPKVVLWGTGSPRREFLHVDDCASACIYLMQNYEGEDIINLGVGEDITIRDLAELVKGIVGFDGEVYWDETKPDGTPRKLVDINRIKSLGWQANIELKEGITRAYLRMISPNMS
ncbi:MAG TPA: GDP-L-fucose synthase [Gammaproteobacteria bacterium]|nr:GDP-L-fucose synthase [Gammaproteobacteria bacterium]